MKKFLLMVLCIGLAIGLTACCCRRKSTKCCPKVECALPCARPCPTRCPQSCPRPCGRRGTRGYSKRIPRRSRVVYEEPIEETSVEVDESMGMGSNKY